MSNDGTDAVAQEEGQSYAHPAMRIILTSPCFTVASFLPEYW